MAEKPKAGSAFGRAATGLLNLGVVGAAAVGAAAIQSWTVLAVGGVTYAALVAWDLVKKERGGPGSVAAAPSLGEPSSYQDPQTSNAVRGILVAKVEIDRVLAETPEDVQANLAHAVGSVSSLMDRAAGLAARCEDLAKYLATKDAAVVRQDVDSLRQRVARASDPQARAQYQTALASREEHVRSLQDLTDSRERVLASLLSIASSLEGLPAKIVHMRALDAAAMDKLGGDVNGELERVNDEMKTFEETLRTLGDTEEKR
ncbi:MAG TPA: hypothetical protein VGI39_26115 [Polyangiaceae bacterium]